MTKERETEGEGGSGEALRGKTSSSERKRSVLFQNEVGNGRTGGGGGGGDTPGLDTP